MCFDKEMWTNSVDFCFAFFLDLFAVYQVLVCMERSWHCEMLNSWKWWCTFTHVQVNFELKAVLAVTISCTLCHHMWEIILSTFYWPFSNVVMAEGSSLLGCCTVSKDHVSNCLPNDMTSQRTWICSNTTERTSNLAICRLLLVPF